MFGLNDNKQDAGSGATYSNYNPPAPAPGAPVHGPMANLSPGSQNSAAGQQGVPTQAAQPDAVQPAMATPRANMPGSSSEETEHLLGIKQQALQNLTPLVNHLGQTPEDKFKTTMMLIQASDDPSLINDAYEAANHIEDEAKRAQALLDVINEINYFTRHPHEQA